MMSFITPRIHYKCQQAQLMLTNPRDALVGRSRSLKVVPFDSSIALLLAHGVGRPPVPPMDSSLIYTDIRIVTSVRNRLMAL